MNILVLGNGFDLAHGLKTSYSDFVSFIRNKEYLKQEKYDIDNEYFEQLCSIVENNGIIQYLLYIHDGKNDWVDLEKDLNFIVTQVNNYFTNAEIVGSKLFVTDATDPKIYTVFKHLGFGRELGGMGNPIEIDSKFFSLAQGIIFDEVKRYMRILLDGLKDALKIYLICYVPMLSRVKGPFKQILDIHADYVATFNYTDYYRKYGFSEDKVFHIHGDLMADNIVLGFSDDAIPEIYKGSVPLYINMQGDSPT